MSFNLGEWHKSLPQLQCGDYLGSWRGDRSTPNYTKLNADFPYLDLSFLIFLGNRWHIAKKVLTLSKFRR